MPFFDFPFSSFWGTNSFGQDQNCYFCTVAALLGMSTSALVAKAQTMMQDTAQLDEVIDLFRDAGTPASHRAGNDVAGLHTFLLGMPNGHACGLAYNRANGTGHMVVAQRDDGSYPFHTYPRVRIIDCQQRPAKVSTFPPENGVNIIMYHVFYKT